MKPYAETAEENKYVVLPVLEPWLDGVSEVLEIASGTGQQIVYFAEKCPQISWQASDLAENIPGIRLWIEEAGLSNLREPLVLDVAEPSWAGSEIPFIYTSNSLHIMAWPQVEKFFEHAGSYLARGAVMCIYGPFSFDGKHVSESNIRFDRYLQQSGRGSGVRDTAELSTLGKKHKLLLLDAIAMPHNNHILIWQKTD